MAKVASPHGEQGTLEQSALAHGALAHGASADGASAHGALEQVLVELAAASSTGCLFVRDPEGDEAEVFLRDGEIYSVSVPGRRTRLGVRLMSRAALTQEALAEALEIQRTELQGWRLGELLVHLGYVDQAVVEEFVVEQLKDGLAALMGWPVAGWKFRKGKKTRQDVAPPRPVSGLLTDLRERAMTWESILAVIGGTDVAPCRVVGAAEVGDGPNAREVLAKVDGERSVADLASDCGFTLFEAGQAVASLARAGQLEVPAASVPAPGGPGPGPGPGVPGSHDALTQPAGGEADTEAAEQLAATEAAEQATEAVRLAAELAGVLEADRLAAANEAERIAAAEEAERVDDQRVEAERVEAERVEAAEVAVRIAAAEEAERVALADARLAERKVAERELLEEVGRRARAAAERAVGEGAERIAREAAQLREQQAADLAAQDAAEEIARDESRRIEAELTSAAVAGLDGKRNNEGEGPTEAGTTSENRTEEGTRESRRAELAATAAQAAGLLTELSRDSLAHHARLDAEHARDPETEAEPNEGLRQPVADPDGTPRPAGPKPLVARDQADTAMLLRELSSLGFSDDARPSSSPPATARPSRPTPARAPKPKRRKGLFGRG